HGRRGPLVRRLGEGQAVPPVPGGHAGDSGRGPGGDDAPGGVRPGEPAGAALPQEILATRALLLEARVKSLEETAKHLGRLLAQLLVGRRVRYWVLRGEERLGYVIDTAEHHLLTVRETLNVIHDVGLEQIIEVLR